MSGRAELLPRSHRLLEGRSRRNAKIFVLNDWTYNDSEFHISNNTRCVQTPQVVVRGQLCTSWLTCHWELFSVIWSLGIEDNVSSILILELYSSPLGQTLDGLWLVTVFLSSGKVLCTSCITEMRSDVCQRLGRVSIKMAWKWSISPVGNWTRSVPGIALWR